MKAGPATSVLALILAAHPASAQPAPPDPDAVASPGDEAPSDDAPIPTPTPPAPGADEGVDIITSAGKELPAQYQASIVLEKDAIVWDPRWRKFETGNWVATGVGLAIAFGSLVIPPTPDRWNSPPAFDWEVRNALKPDRLSDQHTARDASDVLLTISVNQLLIDTLVVTWWGHNADSVAYQMALMNVEMLAFNTAINSLVSGFVSRERPYPRELCGSDGDETIGDCSSSSRYRSFYSGHTSTTFAVAASTCLHHGYLPLYGGGAADALACVFSIGVAGATGTLRVVGDRHWASDVLVGAAMGTFSGLAVPYFLHYRTGDLPEAEGDAISVNLVPTPTGALVTGVF